MPNELQGWQLTFLIYNSSKNISNIWLPEENINLFNYLMKRKSFMFIMASLCSLCAFCQKTIPVFTVTNELLTASVCSVWDAESILKRNGLATDESCEVTKSEYYYSAKVLKSVTYNEKYGAIVIEIIYDPQQTASKFFAVSFTITKNYLEIFKSYLKKNDYKFIGERPDFPWTQFYSGKFTCAVTPLPDNGLTIMFLHRK